MTFRNNIGTIKKGKIMLISNAYTNRNFKANESNFRLKKIVLIQRKWREYTNIKAITRQVVLIQTYWRATSLRGKISKIFHIYLIIDNLSKIFSIQCKRILFWHLNNIVITPNHTSLLEVFRLHSNFVINVFWKYFIKWNKKAILKSLQMKNNKVRLGFKKEKI